MTDDLVRLQYEDYPYPPRDPADEQKRLITGSPSQICEINHYFRFIDVVSEGRYPSPGDVDVVATSEVWAAARRANR